MVVYAVAADASIIRVFLAGIMPGVLLMALFSGYIIVWALLNPERTPGAGERVPLREKLRRSRELIPCALLIVFILYVLLAGLATATECAAYGVLGSLIIAWWGGSLTRAKFAESLVGATRVSCMIMFILAGASFLSKAMAFTGIPRELAEWVGALGLNRYALIAILAVFYVILGTALDGISMIVLTAAVVLPMIQTAGFDLVWFGVFVVLLVEIAEVTPPVGFNLFVLQNMTGKDSNTIARASLPFFAMLLVAIALITIFPAIATWLPDLVMGAQL
jgi:tripartite ATP-independent transporter DctM subunit